MTQAPDHHEESADALKALADGAHKLTQGSEDGFVGPEEPEESEEAPAQTAEGVAVDPASQGYDLLPDAAAPPADLAAGVPSRRQRAADFDQRERLAHAHQYKAVMIPLLITMGVLLLLLGIYAVIRGAGAEAADPGAEAAAGNAIQKWFPILAFPLGAFLLAGAWYFHHDVTRKRK